MAARDSGWKRTRIAPRHRRVPPTPLVPRSFPTPPHACRDDHLRHWPEGAAYPEGCGADGCAPLPGSGGEL